MENRIDEIGVIRMMPSDIVRQVPTGWSWKGSNELSGQRDAGKLKSLIMSC